MDGDWKMFAGGQSHCYHMYIRGGMTNVFRTHFVASSVGYGIKLVFTRTQPRLLQVRHDLSSHHAITRWEVMMATRPFHPDHHQLAARREIDRKEAARRKKRIGSQQVRQREVDQSLWRLARLSRILRRASGSRHKSRRSRFRVMRMKASSRLTMKSKSLRRRHQRTLRHPGKLPLDLNWADENLVTRRREESRQLLEYKGRQPSNQLLVPPRKHRLTPHHRGVLLMPNRHMSVSLEPDLIWKTSRADRRWMNLEPKSRARER